MNAPTAVRSPVQIGVLSFAHYHANFWSEVFAARGALTGVWDSDVTRGREAAARFGTDFFDNIDALLERCSGVAICSETVMHPELVECAARRGLAILCEKPQGIDLPSCDRIARAVRAAGVPFMQSFPKRLDPVTAYLRAIVQSGELGRITLVRIRHGHFYGLEPDFATRWYTDPARSGGGASFCLAAADTSIEMYGTEGTVLVSGVDLASRDITTEAFVRIFRRSQGERGWQKVPLVPRFKLGGFHQQNAVVFADCLERGELPPTSVEDGRRASAMIAAAYLAAQTGRLQEIVP
ncbi:MAG: gfo/Idh/MocA family oxidoreductase [Betaproteobacteria bacterium]|nr:gfo/Idh/MocA family oxidoreductase [Betaproteobacteria bacterium]